MGEDLDKVIAEIKERHEHDDKHYEFVGAKQVHVDRSTLIVMFDESERLRKIAVSGRISDTTVRDRLQAELTAAQAECERLQDVLMIKDIYISSLVSSGVIKGAKS